MKRTEIQVNRIEQLTEVYLSVFEVAHKAATENLEGQIDRDRRAPLVAHNVTVLYLEEQQRNGVSL